MMWGHSSRVSEGASTQWSTPNITNGGHRYFAVNWIAGVLVLCVLGSLRSCSFKTWENYICLERHLEAGKFQDLLLLSAS